MVSVPEGALGRNQNIAQLEQHLPYTEKIFVQIELF